MPYFVPRQRKHKKLARQKDGADTNVKEILQISQVEREARRTALKQRLRDEQPESKFSSQKRKRLEKYIDTKLRREENAELIRKLAAQHVDTSQLQSSKTLGKAQETKREKRQRSTDVSDDDTFEVEKQQEETLVSSRSTAASTTSADGIQPPDLQPTTIAPFIHTPASTTDGAGLKRPLQVDESGKPIIKKRKRRKLADSRVVHREQDWQTTATSSDSVASSQDEDTWNGFSDVEGESQRDNDGPPLSSVGKDFESSDNESVSSIDDDNTADETPTRISAFKAWGKSQINAAVGFVPSQESIQNGANEDIKASFKPRALSPDPLFQSLISHEPARTVSSAAAITISRPEHVQASRLELPVVQEEQKIIEAIHANPVTLICGATGSGKTTQVPQMLFENGYGSKIGSSSADLAARRMIGVTQPRRVAATSVADRVAHELGVDHGKRVAHQVRYDTNVSKDTAIKFMTDGILLREIQADFSLEKYSCIIIDEAHERSVNTDILIGLLSRIVPLRDELSLEQPEKFCPLKLVIMSATLRVNDFLLNDRLFRNIKPPVVEIQGRQYSVTEHFARRTNRDYVSDMVEKVARGHRKLPPGGILVFLTGQDEIHTASKHLKERLMESRGTNDERSMWIIDDSGDELMDDRYQNKFLDGEESDIEDAGSEVDLNIGEEEDDFAIEENDVDKTMPRAVLKPHILPLYASLPAAQQQKVFQPTPDGYRQIILSTNVAETSLTIPGIRYVFDCGRSKEKRYNHRNGVQTFKVSWISKASAAQRQGRAGRTGPGGHVWRLYSSAVYERDFEPYTVPEILRTPLESIVLQLKGFEIENVANFPFPTPPDLEQLEIAERLLSNLGAISGEKISEVGLGIMAYPVNPRLGKTLWLAKRNDVGQHAIAIIAALALGDLYIPEAQSTQEDSVRGENGGTLEKQHQTYTRAQATLSRWDDQTDAVKLLKAVSGHAEAQSKSNEAARTFCKDFWLREKSMQEIQQLRMQLQAIVKSQEDTTTSNFALTPTEPTDKQRTILKQILVAGFIDQVAIRADKLGESNASFGRKPSRAIEVAYRTLVPLISEAEVDRTASPVDQEFQKSVFIHPSSVLARKNAKDMPDYIVYSHLSQAMASTVDGKRKKTRIHPLTSVGPKALAELAEKTPLLRFGKPVGKIEELPNRRRQCWVGVSLRAPGGVGLDWPLSTWKVVQKRSNRGEWVVENVVAR